MIMKKSISDSELFDIARRARESSYSPYSGISVGAALLCGSGKIYTGANIENAAYSPSVCAERVAIFRAIHSGERELIKIAVAGGRAGEDEQKLFTPCGVCRQVMAEFCKSDFTIVLGENEALTLEELLPYGFDKEKIK
jgi:cytidine deaminase